MSTSSTVHAHQTPSSSPALALKPTIWGIAITFLVNRAFSSCDQNRFAIDKAGQLVLMNLQSVARILSGVQCPWIVLAPHFACVNENRNSNKLRTFPCWSRKIVRDKMLPPVRLQIHVELQDDDELIRVA